MLVEFLMETNDININFKVFGKRNGNIITFPDKSVPNTIISLEIWDNKIEIKRNGDVCMLQTFRLNEKCLGYYKNSSGINLDISSITKEMIIGNNEIYIEYDYYLEDEWQSRNKLKIIF